MATFPKINNREGPNKPKARPNFRNGLDTHTDFLKI